MDTVHHLLWLYTRVQWEHQITPRMGHQFTLLLYLSPVFSISGKPFKWNTILIYFIKKSHNFLKTSIFNQTLSILLERNCKDLDSHICCKTQNGLITKWLIAVVKQNISLMTYETVAQLLTYVEAYSLQRRWCHLVWSLKWFSSLTVKVSFCLRLLMRDTC